jgi:O-antigen/teichoic acid export membrane protein
LSIGFAPSFSERASSVSLRTKLFLDGLYTFAFRIGNIALTALLGILTARALGPHGRGIYSFPVVDAGLVSAAYAGLSTATSYFMLRRKAGRAILAPALWSAALFVIIGIPAADILARGEGAPWAAVPAILSLPGSALLFTLFGYQVGVDRARLNAWYALLNTAVLVALMLGALTLFGHTPPAAIAAWVATAILFALFILIWLVVSARRLQPGEPVGIREFFSYAVRMGAVSLVSLLNYRADVYIVAILAGPTLLGMYTLAVAAAELILAATQVTAIVSSPHIGGLASTRAAAMLTARCVRNNVLIALVTCGLLWFIAPVAIRLLYGGAFLPMIPAFRILLIGVFALSLGSPMSTYFTIRMGKPQIALLLASVSATVCIVVSVLSIRPLGMIGAALGSTLGYLLGQSLAFAAFIRMTEVPLLQMLVPRWSDVTDYVEASTSLLRRLRGIA